MGYVVQVWDQPEGLPRPATLREAIVLAERAGDGQGPRSERLAGLRSARTIASLSVAGLGRPSS